MPKGGDDFYSVLSAAVDDLTENGFDSIDRVERWARLIRIAAERSLVAPESLEERLREGLASIYRKMVENNGLLKFNPGIERFTFERLKPALRPELDRRIMASAQLIKLNRAEAIDATIRRFQGWATSVPPGGVSGETRAEVRKNVRKGLAQLPFEERRVLIDQGAKLVSSINDVIASDGGAIAGQWVSHYMQPGYNYREDHKERDYRQNGGAAYLIRDSWAHRAALVKPGKLGYVDDVTAPAVEPFCRCYYRYLYALRDLPEDMLTAKGKKALASVQGMEEVRAARQGRADSLARGDTMEAPPRPGVGYQAMRTRLARLREQLAETETDSLISVAFEQAMRLDRLHYLAATKPLRVMGDTDKWNAGYDPEKDQITIQAKVADKPFAERVQILLHEAGHRGEMLDAPTFEDFKAQSLDRLEAFVDMANAVHLEDFARRGKVDQLASEVFAESYARYMLGILQPPELVAFWHRRLGLGATGEAA